MNRTIVKSNFLLALLSIIQLMSCQNNPIENAGNVAEIRYGGSFGMCVGYCRREMIMTKDSILFNFSAWSDSIPSVHRSVSIPPQTWDSVRLLLDVEALLGLPEYIGCPDCADGGAEWLEVTTIGCVAHKVTFEYGKEPDELRKCVTKCREIFSKSDN